MLNAFKFSNSMRKREIMKSGERDWTIEHINHCSLLIPPAPWASWLACRSGHSGSALPLNSASSTYQPPRHRDKCFVEASSMTHCFVFSFVFFRCPYIRPHRPQWVICIIIVVVVVFVLVRWCLAFTFGFLRVVLDFSPFSLLPWGIISWLASAIFDRSITSVCARRCVLHGSRELHEMRISLQLPREPRTIVYSMWISPYFPVTWSEH